MNHESKRKVTLENLLRLKQAERPPAEFWARFDRELRTKQLSALFDKRPWWSRISHSMAGLARYRLPLGATAILAVTFLSVREYRLDSETKISDVAAPAVRPAPAVVSTGVLNVESNATVYAEAGVLPVYDARDSGVAPAPEVAADVQTTNGNGLSHMVSLFKGVADPRTSDLIAANLAATKAAESLVARSLLGTSQGFENRALSVPVQAVEPLAQMTHPSEVRSARLLSAVAASISSSGLPPRAGGSRISRQNVADDRLYDQPHRLEGAGDRLSFKF